MQHLNSPTRPRASSPLSHAPSDRILSNKSHAPPPTMSFSPFLPAASNSAADLVGVVDFDWLPDSSIKLIWNSELSDSCGDGSTTSPPQPPTIRRPTNNFLLQQSFGLLNPSLQTNDPLQRTVSSAAVPASAADNLLHRPSFLVNDFQKKLNEGGESPMSCESSNMMTIEGMSRAYRYTPEQKKQRIEKYRTKRNQRNFNKKIKEVLGR